MVQELFTVKYGDIVVLDIFNPFYPLYALVFSSTLSFARVATCIILKI